MARPCAANTLRQSLRGSSSRASSGMLLNSQANTQTVGQRSRTGALCGGVKQRNTQSRPSSRSASYSASTSDGSRTSTMRPRLSSAERNPSSTKK